MPREYQFPFELRHLVYFREVARQLHFRKAAETLVIAQPALSRAIAQLETALASRAAYQSVLTPAGLDEICSEILSADGIEYFEAEEYHQKYLQKNPNGYDCHSSTGVAYPVS